MLLKSDAAKPVGFQTKLSDFGLAKILRENYYIVNRWGQGHLMRTLWPADRPQWNEAGVLTYHVPSLQLALVRRLWCEVLRGYNNQPWSLFCLMTPLPAILAGRDLAPSRTWRLSCSKWAASLRPQWTPSHSVSW